MFTLFRRFSILAYARNYVSIIIVCQPEPTIIAAIDHQNVSSNRFMADQGKQTHALAMERCSCGGKVTLALSYEIKRSVYLPTNANAQNENDRSILVQVD